MVDEDPGHGHLDRELDPLAHRHLQVELAIPELGQVAAILEAPWIIGQEDVSIVTEKIGRGVQTQAFMFFFAALLSPILAGFK